MNIFCLVQMILKQSAKILSSDVSQKFIWHATIGVKYSVVYDVSISEFMLFSFRG